MIKSFFANKRLLLISGLIIVFVVVGFLFFSGFLATKLTFAQNYFKSAIVKRGTIKTQVIFSGTVDFEQRALLEFQQIPTTGTDITYVGVRLGDRVKKGQLIASLDPGPVQKQLQVNLNSYSKQRTTFDQTIYNNNGISDPNAALNPIQKWALQNNQLGLDSSVYNVELQNYTLQFSNIWTPIDGVVTRVDTPNAGVNITTPDEARFEIINPSTNIFSVDLDQVEVVNLHEGDKGVVILDSYPTEYIESAVKNISLTPHQDSNGNNVYTVKMTLTSTNLDYKYRLGMTGNAIFYTLAENVLYIPNEFIHQDDNGSYIILGQERKKMYMLPGISDGKNTEIIKGLNEGDVIYY